MAKMKAVQVPKAGADFELVEREILEPGSGHVRIHDIPGKRPSFVITSL